MKDYDYTDQKLKGCEKRSNDIKIVTARREVNAC